MLKYITKCKIGNILLFFSFNFSFVYPQNMFWLRKYINIFDYTVLTSDLFSYMSIYIRGKKVRDIWGCFGITESKGIGDICNSYI